MEKKNLIFLGPGKSGTTYLYNLLSKNNYNVGSIKESNYLLRGSNYWRLYQNEYGGRVIDFSNTYFWNPNIAMKLNERSDSFIVVVLYRDPYARLASHLNYLRSRGQLRGDWREYLANDRDLLLSLSFDWYLSLWKKYFKGRIEIIDFNDLKDKEVLNARLVSLGIELTNWDVDVYKTEYVQGSWYTRNIYLFSKHLKPLLPNRLVQNIKKRLETKLITRFAKSHKISKITAEEIQAFLGE